MDVLQAIIEHGLSIRQLPTEIVSTLGAEHHREGNEIIEHEMTSFTYDYYLSHVIVGANWRFDEQNRKVYRRFTRSVKVPEHAGWWMCQASPTNTSSRVEWRMRDHNLAPTLKESVDLYVSSLKTKGSVSI